MKDVMQKLLSDPESREAGKMEGFAMKSVENDLPWLP